MTTHPFPSSRAASAGLALVLGSIAGAAHAQSRIDVRYEAPHGCPSQQDFVSAVEARGASFEGETPRVHVLRAAITPQDDGFLGTLRVHGDDSASAVREVRADACPAVVEGLAVIAAIAIGPEDATAAVPSTGAAGSATPSQTPAQVQRSQPTPPDAKPPLRLRGSSFGQEETLPVEAGELRFDHVSQYTLMAGAEIGLIPSLVMPRYDFVLSGADFMTPPGGVSRLVGQILQVDWTWLGPATRVSGELATRAYGLQAALRSCAAFAYDTDGWSLLVCGEFGLGWMSLDTRDGEGKVIQAKDTGYGLAGMGAEVKYGLGGPWHVGLRVGAHLAIGGLSAERSDGSRIFDASWYGGHALMGLGMHFW
jgi:hypothetical protein